MSTRRILKPTSQQIQNTVSNCENNLESVVQYIKTNNLNTLEYEETNIIDSILQLRSVLKILNEKCNDGEIDNISSLTRSQMLSYLQTIYQYLPNFNSNYSGYYQALIQYINLLYELILSKGLTKKDKFNYEQKLEKLLAKEIIYEKKLSELNQYIELLHKLETKTNKLESLSNNFEKLTIPNFENLVSQTEESANKIESIRSNLYKFNETVESQIARNTIAQARVEKTSEDLDSLKVRFEDLIPKSVGSSLYNTFNIRKEEFDKSKKMWFWWLLGSIVSLIFSTLAITYFFHADFSSGNIFIFFLRFFLTSPLIYFIIFCNRQYGRDKKLEEEYAFKSSMSLTSDLFRRLVAEEQDTTTKDFIINTVKDIYTSPRELYHKFPNLKDEEVDFEKLGEIYFNEVVKTNVKNITLENTKPK
jgi:hypothetical protein